jgi:hypothetical protein
MIFDMTMFFVAITTTERTILPVTMDKDEMAIYPDIFNDGDMVQFKLSVETDTYRTEVSYVVSVNFPPYNGNCTVTPRAGKI